MTGISYADYGDAKRIILDASNLSIYYPLSMKCVSSESKFHRSRSRHECKITDTSIIVSTEFKPTADINEDVTINGIPGDATFEKSFYDCQTTENLVLRLSNDTPEYSEPVELQEGVLRNISVFSFCEAAD